MRYFELTDSQVVDEEKIKDIYFILYGTYIPNTAALDNFIDDCKGIEREFNPTVKFFAENGYKVKAIKLFRDSVGCTLAEAREYVEKNYFNKGGDSDYSDCE